MANFNQVFKSTDLNAPTLTGQVGSLITLLNKCVVDGYSTATISTITRGGTGNLTALVTLSAADSTLYDKVYATVSGCSGTGASQYNVTALWRVPQPWLPSTTYVVPQLVNNSGNTYICRTGGTSASSGGPTGTGTFK